ncbi:hypothetical protein M1373_01535 [Candidatus Marsarchaeota archaeon]|nr:hypothetical protein [Candidatus Marsarchaeota archaeon]MCL5404981.1 hypothetical protein [Candidatus Marsarchaeota archaeon]
MADVKNEIAAADRLLKSRQETYDKANELARDIVRSSGIAIARMHNTSAAGPSLSRIKAMVEKLKSMELSNSNIKLQALQEYSEAAIFKEIKRSGSVPPMGALGVGEQAYLLGLMDAIGELKREVFESLNRGDLKLAEKYTAIMANAYDASRQIRYQDSILPGFRRKQDAARIMLESCMSELLYFKLHSK